jgi:hypothetical protein
MLSKEDIVAIASRIFAIYVVIMTVQSVGALMNMRQVMEMSITDPDLLPFLLMCVLSLLLAVLLWFFPLTIARKLLPVLRDPRPPLSAAGQDVEDTVVFVLGLWVLASAAPDIVYWMVLAFRIQNTEAASVPLLPEQVASIWATVAQIAIGLWLVFGARGLLGALRRLRYAGAPQKSD